MVKEALNQLKKKTIDLCHAADILSQEILKALFMHGQPRRQRSNIQGCLQSNCKYGNDFSKARLFGSSRCQGLVACLYANASPLSYCFFTLETIKTFKKLPSVHCVKIKVIAFTLPIQPTPDNSNLQGKSKKVRVIEGSSYRELEENSRE